MKKFPITQIKRAAFGVVLVVMVVGIWRMRHRLVELLSQADWRLVGAAALVALLYLPFNASVWGLVFRALGVEVSRPRSAVIWIRCEAMRYLPGGIWGYASRVVEAKRLGVSRGTAALSLTLELALTVVSWGIVAVTGLLVSGIGLELVQPFLPGKMIVAVVSVSGAVAGGIAIWKFRRRIVAYLKGSLRPLSALRVLAEYSVLNFFFGLGFYLCFRALIGDDAPGYFAATGVNAVAWFAGMLAIGVPAGLGVREGACYLMFQPFGLGETAAAAALLFRGVQMLVEFFVLGMATLVSAEKKKEEALV